MKAFSTLLAATLLAASFGAQAQSSTTTSAAPAAAKPETTAPASADVTSATTAPADGAAAAPAEPKLSAAAMRARGGTARPGSRVAPSKPAAAPGFKDGVTIRDGKVVATESGRSTVLTDAMTIKLVTGLEANATGVVTRPDGTTETLKEGDHISLTGRLTTAEDRTSHAQSLKENLKEDRKTAAKKARSPLRQIQL